MSVSDHIPLTRRAVRNAARATGEQPTLSGAADSGEAPLINEPESGEQPLTRRRLRELRDQGIVVTGEVAVTGLVDVVEPEPEPGLQPEPEPEPEPEPSMPAGDTAPQPPIDVTSPPPAAAAEPKSGWAAPEGHWTRQLDDEDDEEALLEATFSREVRAANPTTSTIVIQDAPAAMDLGGPLDSTGEILLTGSIPLSQSLGITGSVERLSDGEADGDDLFDQHRLSHSAQDGQPVRASAIASQHALGTPIVSDGKTRGGRGLTILLIVASSLAVLVTGLVVTALILKWI